MRLPAAAAACALAVALCAAGRAVADDGDVKAEIEALKRQVREQERKIRELEGKGLTQDEVQAAVSRYLGDDPGAVLVGGAEGGKAGWPVGKKPFLQQGPNRLEIGMRWQVRYEAFLYSHDAVGTVGDGGSPETFSLSDAAPRDRSGFEIERMLLDFGGSIFCEDLTYFFQVNFDTDFGGTVEKRFAYMDYRYAGDHHVRAGSDKVFYGVEEQTSSGSLAFVDRSLVMKAFDVGWQTGVFAWGWFGSACRPKSLFYKASVTNGEGRTDAEGGGGLALGSVFNRDARDTFSDQPMFDAAAEWSLTGEEYKLDMVDHREADERCKALGAVGAAAYFEDDDDSSHGGWGGLVLRSTGPARRTGLDAWFRGAWNGFTLYAEWLYRDVDWSNGASRQTDMGAEATLHYRFPDSPWGLGVRGGVVWIDGDYDTITVGPDTVRLSDTIVEVGAVVNYFVWNHNNKVSLDVNWVKDNSGVSSTSAGYLVDPKKGVVVEDGVMVRIQWQLMF